MAKNKTYSVTGRIIAVVGIDITAESLEAATAKSKDLDWNDFITVDGDHHDSSCQIVGVNIEGGWRTDQ